MVDVKTLFEKSDVIWEQVKDVPYGFAIGMLCVALERKVKQEGQDIIEVAGWIGDVIRAVNEQEGETTL